MPYLQIMWKAMIFYTLINAIEQPEVTSDWYLGHFQNMYTYSTIATPTEQLPADLLKAVLQGSSF